MPFPKKPVGKKITWLSPELVAEVKFSELTNDGILRVPVFLRLRPDKEPRDCTLAELKRDVRNDITEDTEETAVDNATSSDNPERTKSVKKAGKLSTVEVVDLDARRQQKQVSESKQESKLYPVDPGLIAKLENANGNKLILEVEGHNISFSNLDKVFWPATDEHSGLTKRDYALYLCRVAPWLIPHTASRPITFLRFPNGILGGKFYQKHWDKGLPEFVNTVLIYGENAGADQQYLLCDNLASLLWLAQIADLELHTWQSRTNPQPENSELPLTFSGSGESLDASLLNYPDYLLFDLDPYIYSGKEKTGEEPALNLQAFKQTCNLAKWLKEILDTLEIEAFIKTTGKTGLHMYIPINRDFTFDEVRAISDTIGRAVLNRHPNDVTMDWAVVKRTGKIFLDHNMNARGKTLASIYSPRVSPEAAVSMPIQWDQLDDIYPTDFTMHSVPGLLAQQGDLWADILEHKTDLRRLFDRNRKSDEAEAKPKSRKRRKSS